MGISVGGSAHKGSTQQAHRSGQGAGTKKVSAHKDEHSHTVHAKGSSTGSDDKKTSTLTKIFAKVLRTNAQRAPVSESRDDADEPGSRSVFHRTSTKDSIDISHASEAGHGIARQADDGSDDEDNKSIQDEAHNSESAQAQKGQEKAGDKPDNFNDIIALGRKGAQNVWNSLQAQGDRAEGTVKNTLHTRGDRNVSMGEGISKAGTSISGGGDWLAEQGKKLDDTSAPERIKVAGEVGAGVLSGTLGFVGGTVSGIGDIQKGYGKVLQGDTETIGGIRNAASTAGEFTELSASRSLMMGGAAARYVGDATGLQNVTDIGNKVSRTGQGMYDNVSDTPKIITNNLWEAGRHYGSKVSGYGGGLLQTAGRATWNQDIEEVGKNISLNAQATEARTADNSLVTAIDTAVDNRLNEYDGRGGTVAVARDVTRGVLEVGGILVSPGALAGKTGTVAHGAKAVDSAGDILKAADTAGDALKAADTAGDALKAADSAGDALKAADSAGDALHTADRADGLINVTDDLAGSEKALAAGKEYVKLPDGTLTRKVLDKDGLTWDECITPGGQTYKSRIRTETVKNPDGSTASIDWLERIEGNNRTLNRSPEAVMKESKALGSTSFTVKGQNGQTTIEVYGGATEAELAKLQKLLNDVPEVSRVHARNIYLSDNLGKGLTMTGEENGGIVAGFASGRKIVIDRTCLNPDPLYHEMGHVLDNSLGCVSQEAGSPWGSGEFLGNAAYAATNRAEDFAETHKVVLSDWDRLTSMSKSEFYRQPGAEKKAEILRLYGYDVN